MDVITLALAKKYVKDLKSNITNIKPSADKSSIVFTLTNGTQFSIPLVSAVPTIGENGNWFINGIDTGKASQGEKGEPGIAGQDGANGKDGTDYVLTDDDKSTIAQLVYDNYISTLNQQLENRLNGGGVANG